jgi:P27 family predicted phage terminase small subunit
MVLSESAQKIFDEIKGHCTQKMGFIEVDVHSLEMLANAIDTYSKCAKIINEKGYTQTSQSGFDVLRPEIAIMKDCYDKVLKGADKFGLNPASRKKIFAMKTEEAKKKGFKLDGKN